jgi:hypothetical protein
MTRLCTRFVVATMLGMAATSALAQTTARRVEGLGRVFFTPEERGALDAERNAAKAKPLQAVTAETSPTSTLSPQPATPKPTRARVERSTVTGYVVRSSGNSTVWLNDTPRYRHELVARPSDRPALGASAPTLSED